MRVGVWEDKGWAPAKAPSSFPLSSVEGWGPQGAQGRKRSSPLPAAEADPHASHTAGRRQL